jgi:hypothetical protein
MAKALTPTQKKELDSLKKKIPTGVYSQKGYYSIRVVGYMHDGVKPLVKLRFVNNPNYGTSMWKNDLKNAKDILKGMKLQK